jgi:hypothetical protein
MLRVEPKPSSCITEAKAKQHLEGSLPGSARATARLLLVPVLTIPLGILDVLALGLPRRLVVFVTLGAICTGLIGMAMHRARAAIRPEVGTRGVVRISPTIFREERR